MNMRIMTLATILCCVTLAAPALRAQERDVKRLAATLGVSDAEARQQAADELAEFGVQAKAAIPQLLTALAHSDPDLRWRAARALGAVGPAAAEAAPALVKALTDRNALVRAQAARALGLIAMKSPQIVEALVARVADGDAQVRRAAIAAIRRLHPGPKVVLPLLAKTLEDADPSVVLPALQSLAEVGPDAMPVLLEALSHPRGRYWACLVLAEMGPKAQAAVPALAKLLTDEDPEVRMQAVITLGEIGPGAKTSLAEILKALADDHGGVRYGAAYALAKIGAVESLPALAKAAADKDPFLQVLAPWAAAKIKPSDEKLVQTAVERLVAGLKSSDANVRRASARGLFELGADKQAVAPALAAALDDPDPTVQGNVYKALASLGAKAVPRVVGRLKDPKTRGKALRILALMGPEAAAAVPDLEAALRGADAATRNEVLYALAAIGPGSAPAVPGLIHEMTSDEDPQVRITACYALGKIGPGAKAAVPALVKNVASKDRFLRLVSVWALLRIQPGDVQTEKMAIPLLAAALSEVESELGKVEAAAALGDIGVGARDAVPALKNALNDQSPAVREAAAAALKKIQG
jgi:HEAT repeat protein